MCCKRAALIALRCFNAAGRMSRDARGFLSLRKGTLRSLLIYAVSICPAAGQVVENTPCPAVNFFFNFQLIISNPCSHG